MYSLKKQLNKSLLLNMIVMMLAMIIMLSIFTQQMLKDQLLTRLQHDAESLVSVLQQTTDQRWEVNPAHISTVYNRVRSGHYYIVKVAEQTIRSRSLFDFEVSVTELNEALSMSYQMDGAGNERWLVWQQVIYKGGQQFHLWVAEDITAVQQQLVRFFIAVLFLVIVISFILIYMQQKILNRAFGVFDFLRNNLKTIRHGDTDKADTLVPIEISPLIKEIEMLVGQLKQRIQRTRNAIGNLAHEIKRPLQLLSLHLETGDDKESATVAYQDIKTIVARELRRAKITGSNVIGGVFKLQEELPVLLDVMKKIYPEISSELLIQEGINEVNLDRDDMLELTGNLIDNACKYAAHKIYIRIKVIGNSWQLTVEDDGKGVDKDQMNLITRKGLRLDETVQGHGLGLGICSDIIESYEGGLGFDQSTMGGLRVQVNLPLQPD